MTVEVQDRPTDYIVMRTATLRRWYRLFCIGGRNTKATVREEIKKELGEELKFGSYGIEDQVSEN